MSIYGQTFTVSTEGNPRDLEALAREISELLSTLASKTGIGDTARVALLACLHLADENRRMKGRLGGISQALASIELDAERDSQ
ncbi:MAG: cell division protein ZapA [Acidobacteria bacterium]|nr:cell division protein ZapA [Acidobacteriota bacterium]